MANIKLILNNGIEYNIVEDVTDLSSYLEKLNNDKNVALAIGNIVNNKMSIQHIQLVNGITPNVKVITQNGYEILVAVDNYNPIETETLINNTPVFILLGNTIINKNVTRTIEPIVV